MGKSRRNRARAHRANPILRKTTNSASDVNPELAALRENRVLPIISKLRSCDAKSRTEAASAVANIVQNEQCRKLLLREQIVHVVLTETLTDASVDSRAAGWEILKVLVEEEDDGFCVHLFRLDILTAIEHAAKAIVESVTGTDPVFTKLLKAQQRLVWDISGSLVSLLGALALARDEILEAIVSNKTITGFLFCLILTESVPSNVLDEVFSCLMTLSEDNLQFGQAIINDQPCYNHLLKISGGGSSKAAYACGVLHNVFSCLQWQDHSPGRDGACDAILVPALVRVLKQTSLDRNKTNGQNGNPVEILQLALEIIASIGTHLQSTLERGNRAQPSVGNEEKEWTGFEDGDAMEIDGEGLAEDEEEGDDDGDDDSDSDDDDKPVEEDESDMDDIDADMERVTGGDGDIEEVSGLDDLPTLRELLNKAIPQLIRLSQTSVGSDEIVAIQGYALSALNNISWTMSCLDLLDKENAGIWKAWQPVAEKIWSKVVAPILEADNADLDLATMVTTLAWAVSRTLPGSVPLIGNEHRKFMSLYQASKSPGQGNDHKTSSEDEESEDPFQSLGVKCIGVLGQLAKDPGHVDINREIGIFLLTVLSAPQTPAADLIEAANQVFDIWADENLPCEQVFWKENFLEKLESLVPRFKTMAKGIDKRKSTELRARADEASLNLGRFIQYKKSHPLGET